MLYIGIDLGTSACKLLLVDQNGTVLNEVTKDYPLSFPYPGWSEQNPEDWWATVTEGVPELLAGLSTGRLRCRSGGGHRRRRSDAWAGGAG